MEFLFSNLLNNNGELEKPKGIIRQEGKNFYAGQEALKKLISEKFKVEFDEKYVIRYNNTNSYSYGGNESHRGEGKIAIAITKVGNGYRYFVKKVDEIESNAITGSWSISKAEYTQITPLQDVKQVNEHIVAELEKIRNKE